MPNIAQQDYIIIDWEGKDDSDATKKAEVDAILKNLYLANPLSLFSVIFKNYGVDPDTVAAKLERFVSFLEGTDETVTPYYLDSENGSPVPYSFSIAD